MHNNDLEGPRIEVGPNGISNKPSFESRNNGRFGNVLILLVIVMIFSGALFYGMMAFLKYAQEDLWNDANYVSDTSEISTGTVNSEDYIYIGEWGIKIKIPNGLNKVGYVFMQYGIDGQREGTSILVSGTVGDKLSDFAYLGKNKDGLGGVSRVHKDAFSGPEYDGVEDYLRICGFNSQLVFSDDTYNYCYSHPQAVYSTDEEEIKIETETTGLIQEMLTNPDNYSKI